jgi:sarcosine oxidase, subunit beta
VSGLLSRRPVYLRQLEPRTSYDAIVIGAGGHGLATAYYLASVHGLTNVGVFERGYLGSGATGRNTTIVRANYKMPESIEFFRESYDLFSRLSLELDYNLLFSKRGICNLAHTESSLRTQRERVLLNQALGVDTVFIGPDEIRELCPHLDLTAGGHGRPVLGASYHPPGAVVRHDAVVWGYAAAAQRLGVSVHEGVEVTGIEIERQRCLGVHTSSGFVSAGAVISAAGGYSSMVAALAGIRLPIVTHPLQAFVTEPYKPILNQIVSSSDTLVYVSQTSRGEILCGGEIEPYSTYSTRSTFSFLAECASRCMDLLPVLAKLRILRQWTGLCDMSPDYSPMMGFTEVENFFLTTGWGTWGFKAIPAGGKAMAELVATRKVPRLIAPFRLDRFHDDRCVPDRSSAGTH